MMVRYCQEAVYSPTWHRIIRILIVTYEGHSVITKEETKKGEERILKTLPCAGAVQALLSADELWSCQYDKNIISSTFQKSLTINRLWQKLPVMTNHKCGQLQDHKKLPGKTCFFPGWAIFHPFFNVLTVKIASTISLTLQKTSEPLFGSLFVEYMEFWYNSQVTLADLESCCYRHMLAKLSMIDVTYVKYAQNLISKV